MNRIKKLLRLRKQNDRVKIVFVLFILGIACMLLAISSLYSIAHGLNSPREYTFSMVGEFNEEQFNELFTIKNVSAASCQAEEVTEFTVGEQVYTYTVNLVSKEYLHQVYHIVDDYVMPVLYVPREEYEKLVVSANGRLDEGDILAKYMDGSTLRIKCYEPMHVASQDLPPNHVFMGKNTYELVGKGKSIRVCMAKRSLDGSELQGINKLGYVTRDELSTLMEQHDLEKNWLMAKYRWMMGVAFIIMSILFFKIK